METDHQSPIENNPATEAAAADLGRVAASPGVIGGGEYGWAATTPQPAAGSESLGPAVIGNPGWEKYYNSVEGNQQNGPAPAARLGGDYYRNVHHGATTHTVPPVIGAHPQ
jgi:hypothetical protein